MSKRPYLPKSLSRRAHVLGHHMATGAVRTAGGAFEVECCVCGALAVLESGAWAGDALEVSCAEQQKLGYSPRS